MNTARIIETALSKMCPHSDKQIIADIASLLGQWVEGQLTRDTIRRQLEDQRFISFLQDVAGQSADAKHLHVRFGSGNKYRIISITTKNRTQLRLRIDLRAQKSDSMAHRTHSTWWERMIHHPLTFFSLRVWLILGAIVAVPAGVVAIGADSGAFISQMNNWFLRCQFDREDDNETLIIITTFEQAQGSRGTDPHDAIRRQLVTESTNLGIQNIRPQICDITIDTNTPDNGKQRAEILGKRYNASIVVWGKYTSAEVITHFLNRKQPSAPIFFITIDESERVELVNPTAYANFVTTDLPHQISFLALFALGEAMSNQERFADAVEVIEHAVHLLENVETIPNGAADAYVRLGWLYLGSQQKKQALESYTRAIELNRTLAVAYTHRGSIYVDQKQYEQALADYNQAIKLDANDALAYTGRGIIYVAQGNHEQALKEYNHAIKLDSTPASTYYLRGNIYSDQKQYEQALADYNQAIKLDANDALAYYNRGLAYAEQGKYEQALADYNQAITLDPSLAIAYYNLGGIFADRGNYVQALIYFSQAIERDPEYAPAYVNRGVAYVDGGDYEQALVDFNQAIELDRTYAMAYYNRGLAYAEQGKYEQALADYNQAIKLDSSDATNYSGRGEFYAHQGMYKQALVDFNRAIELDRTYAIAYNNRGKIYADQKQYGQALADFDQAITLDPRLVSAYLDRGVTYARQGMYKQALVDFNRAIELDRTYALVYYNRGLIHACQGSSDDAIADFTHVVDSSNDLHLQQLAQQQIDSIKNR